MAFVPWKDRVTSTPHRYKLTNVSGDTYDLEAVPGAIGEAGTPVNAANLNKLIQRDGDDIKDTVTTFTEASTRANIGTGESTATLFGKIKKWFTDLKPHAFATPSATQSTSADTVPSSKLLRESTFARVYRSFADLGLENSATIADIHAAMINRSRAILPASTYDHPTYGNTGLELPNNHFYVLEAIRNDSERLTLKLVGKAWNSDVLYHYEAMYWNHGTTDKFTGWKRIINDEDAQTITGVKTFATGATPLITDAPTTDLMAVNKAYADNLIPYDKVIRTQAEFEELIASPTWLGATSVALVGQFTYSDENNSGIKIPATVKQIHGFNSAKITITNFKYDENTGKGGLWYAIRPTTNDYSIRDLEVDCTGTGTVTGYGFVNCTNLTNCTGTGTAVEIAIGFLYCTNLTNCTGTGTGTDAYTGNGYGFYSCTNVTNCTGTGTGADAYGFRDCANLTNCTGKGTGAFGYGFSKCTNLTNCTGTGTGDLGYGFHTITYASNCKDGGSTTAMWGGTNKNIVIDDSSAQTISGVKTFATGATPLITDAPTTDLMAVNKKYVDGLSTPYSKVIRTQAEFNALIASPTWLGATSVALVGQFTLSTANNSGIKVPATVKQIHGFNEAKITITNFKYNSSTAKGGLWYDTAPTTLDYSIRDLEVDCTGTETNGYGFRNCTNLTNCTGTGTGTYGIGFRNCTNLTNCTGTGTGNTGYGFRDCTNLTNCTGTGTGSSYGYGFYNITYASNCRAGGVSSTAMWGGTNKNIDVETCRKTPVEANLTTLNT